MGRVAQKTGNLDTWPGSWWSYVTPPSSARLPAGSALPSHVLLGRVTWVGDSPQGPLWLVEALRSRLPPPPAARLPSVTSRRSAVGAPQQQQKREQSGEETERRGRKEKQHGDPRSSHIKEHFYILCLLRRITKIFFLSENNASTSVFEGLWTLLEPFTSARSAAGEFFVLPSATVTGSRDLYLRPSH